MANEPLFKPSTALKRRLGLDNRERFTLAEIRDALRPEADTITALLALPPGDLTAEQHELLTLQDRVIGYDRLLQSLTALLPLNLEIPAGYTLAGTSPDFLALKDHLPAVTEKLKNIIARKGAEPAGYTAQEKTLAEFAYALQQIQGGGRENDTLRVIPASRPGEVFISPWQAIFENENTAALQNWRDMARAWQKGDDAAFQAAAERAADKTPSRFKLELLYNALKPFHLALGLYALALLFLLWPKIKPPLPELVFTAALAAHFFGVAARIIVLSRPPVGTLYEAVLFVSLVCAATAYGVYRRTKNRSLLFCGLIAALTLLAIAPAMLPSGESMEMLVAVLNTNFWLATHVLCITIGYALSILTACLAHGWLAARALGKKDPLLKNLQKSIYIFSIAALLFTALGTALGGIWADQSWGRFWGWDPKENGALLIVLWLAWLQHGRIGGKLAPPFFAAGAAFLNVIVALAWFGVNLLSVGLHSYGFTSGIAEGLALFCAAEILIISALLFYIYKGKNHAA